MLHTKYNFLRDDWPWTQLYQTDSPKKTISNLREYKAFDRPADTIVD